MPPPLVQTPVPTPAPGRLAQLISRAKSLYLSYPQYFIAGAVLTVAGLGVGGYLGVSYMLKTPGGSSSNTAAQNGTNFTGNSGGYSSTGNSSNKSGSNGSKSSSGKNSNGKSSSSGGSTNSSSGSGSSGGSSGGGSSGGGEQSVQTPIAPRTYTVPGGATLVSNGSQLVTALSNGDAVIELANGTYSNSSYFVDSSASSLYAQNLGGATLTAGLVVGGNGSKNGATVEGLAFNITNSGLTFQNSELNSWGNAGKNSRFLDDTFQGNSDIGYGILDYAPSGLVAERLVASHFTGDGLAFSDNSQVSYGSSTSVINTISDITVSYVAASPPGNSNGTAEAGLWVGNPVTNGVNRVKIANAYWMGLWTGNDSWNTTFSNLTIDESGMGVGVGIYIEHYTYHDIFTDFNITGANTGINSEWDDGTLGKAAGHFNTYENGTIDAAGATSGSTAGIYLDEGTDSTTITGVTFKNQTWAAIGAYKNNEEGGGSNSYQNNTYDLSAGVPQISTSHF